MLNNKVYDVLKWITLVLLPALTTLVGVILNCFNVNCTDIVRSEEHTSELQSQR